MGPRLPAVREGGWYHVTNRAADRSILFEGPRAMQQFVAVLESVARRFPIEINAYCIMGTHYHMLVRAAEHDLRQAIQALEVDLPKRPAAVRLIRLSLGRHLLQVTRYIHRNPVDAGLAQHAGDWEWSSFRGYRDRRDAPDWLRTDAVLGWLGSLAPRRGYADYVDR